MQAYLPYADTDLIVEQINRLSFLFIFSDLTHHRIVNFSYMLSSQKSLLTRQGNGWNAKTREHILLSVLV